jgi:hypothetical protein
MLILALGVLIAHAQAAKLAFANTVKVDQGHFSVTLTSGSFVPSRHVLTKVNGSWTIDGVHRHGSFVALPRMELSRISASYKGRNLHVSSRLWKHVYGPNLPEGEWQIGQSFKSIVTPYEITIRLSCADGAAAYWLILHLRKDGRHWRQFVLAS